MIDQKLYQKFRLKSIKHENLKNKIRTIWHSRKIALKEKEIVKNMEEYKMKQKAIIEEKIRILL